MAENTDIKIRISADSSGAVSGLRQAENALRQFAASLGSVEGSGAAGSMEAVAAAAQQAADQIASIAAATEGVGQASEDSAPGLGDLAEGFNDVNDAANTGTAVLGGMRKALVALGAAAALQQYVEVNRQFEATGKALESVLGSAEAASEAFAFTRELADRLGQSTNTLAAEFVDLAASTRGTALEGQATRDIFEALVGAMGRLGKSSADTSNALRAVSQMASKGTVSAEEMRGQLGEALPGAMQALSNATGVAVDDLNQMIESGNLLAVDALPALAKGLNDLGQSVDEVDGLNAALARFENAVQRAFVAIGANGGNTLAGAMIDNAANLVDGLAVTQESLWSTVNAGIQATTNAAEQLRDRVIPQWGQYEQTLSAAAQALMRQIGLAEAQQQSSAESTTALQALSASSIQAASGHTQLADAAEKAAETIKKQGDAATASAAANVALAELSGQTGEQLIAEAEAARVAAEAIQANADAQIKVASETQRYIDVRKTQIEQVWELVEAGKIESGEALSRINAIEKSIETGAKDLEQQQAIQASLESQAEKQRLLAVQTQLAADTFGDQSDTLDDLRKTLESAREEIERLEQAQRDGAAAADELALVQDVIKTKLEELEGPAGQSTLALGRLGRELEALRERERELTNTVEAGVGAAEEIKRAREAEAIAAARLRDGLADLTRKREFEEQQAERTSKTLEAESDLRLDHLRNLKNEAEARGDLVGAMRLEETIRRAEISALESSLAAKQAEVVAAQATVKAKLEEAQAAGLDAQAILALKAAGDDNVATKQREVAAIQESIRAKLQQLEIDRLLSGSGQDLTDTTDQTTAALDRMKSSTESAGGAAAAMDKILRGVVDQLGEVSQDASEAVEGIISSLGSWRDKIAEIRTLEASDFVDTDGVGQLRGELAELEAAADAAETSARGLQNAWSGAFNYFGEFYTGLGAIKELEADIARAEAAAVRTEIAVTAMGDALDGLTDSYDQGDLSLAQYITKLERLRGEYQGLSDDDLSDLTDALADARAEQEDLTASAVDGLNSWREKLAGIYDQEVQIQQLNYQQDRLETELALAEAKRNNNKEEIAALTEQLKLIDEYYALQIASAAADEAQAKIDAAKDAADEAARRAALTEGERAYEDAINSLKDQLSAAIIANDQALQESILAQIEAEKRRHEAVIKNLETETKAKSKAVEDSSSNQTTTRATRVETTKTTASPTTPTGSTRTVRLVIDSAELWGDESNVSAFLDALERAGLRSI